MAPDLIDSPAASDAVDVSWLDAAELKAAPKDPRSEVIAALLAEFKAAPPGIFIRSCVVEGRPYFAVGTWTAKRNGKVCRINGAPGSEKSFSAALESALVEAVESERRADGEEHRIWLLPQRTGFALKMWLSVDGKNLTEAHHFALNENGAKRITANEYANLKGGSR